MSQLNNKIKIKRSKIFFLCQALFGSGLLSLSSVIALDIYPLKQSSFSLAQQLEPKLEPSSPPKTEKFEYPQEVTRTFMKGCGFTNNREFCTCSLDKLRSQYSFEEFLKIDQAARETKQVPQEVISIFQACRPK